MDIITRYQAILHRIEECRKKSPLAGPVQLIAVSKGHDKEAILPLLQAGHRVFGENRVKETEEKWSLLREHYPDCVVHLIGSLQTNKVKEALNVADAIETIDRPALIDAIVKEQAKAPSRCKTFYLQVNTGEEPQKGGVIPAKAEELYRYALSQKLPVTGLMCVPPAGVPPAPHFALLYTLKESLGLPYLSMGMSEDYETAIRLGATHIRIGTALFGQRS